MTPIIDQPPKNGWNEWAKYILETLKELKEKGDGRDEKINKLLVDINILKTKMTMRAALSGALASAIPVAIGLIIWLITRNPSQ
jgi:hypothetical protein